MKSLIIKTLTILTFTLFLACGKTTDVVESGTYQGKVIEVEADKTEIYVKTDDGKTLELYFTDETTLTEDGNPVDFEALKVGQSVEVVLKKVGKRLDPISVDIQ